MKSQLATFDELHVVSDLHLGGTSGHRIFSTDSEKALSNFILRLAGRPDPQRRVGLVLNGDIVDFLASDDAKAFDPVGAASKLQTILGDFRSVFDALARFTAGPSNTLVLAVGNHDVELGLPKVRSELLGAVSGGDPAAGARVTFALEGEGFRCRVGGREVHCVHGNDVDEWNIVDYPRVREIARRPEQGLGWVPNAGSRLVIEVMNDIKVDWPFIDLLKPEGFHFVPLLAVLDRGKLSKIAEIFPLAGGYLQGWLKRRGLLSDEAAPPGARAAPEVQRLFELSKRGFDSPADLLARADRNFRDSRDPKELAGPVDDPATLGSIWSALAGWVHGVAAGGSATRSSVLRVLRGLMDDDRSFEFSKEDDTFARLDESVDRSVDFLIAGHTHLERALRRRRGAGFYFNSGTWIRLVPLDQYHLANEEAFAPLFDVLPAKGTRGVDALDPFDLKRRTVVSIHELGDRVLGELRHVSVDGSHEVVKGSRMPR